MPSKTAQRKRRAVTKGRSAKPFIGASTVFAGFGTYGARPRPWNYWAGIRQFNSWVFAAATINANGSANVPLRLYVRRDRSKRASYEYSSDDKNLSLNPVERRKWLCDAIRGKAMIWRTRPVEPFRQDYLCGKHMLKPSHTVIRKSIAFGGDVEEVMEPHPALEVLQSVNPWCNGYELSLLFAIDVQLVGNHYEYVVTDGAGQPLEYWRVPPQWTAIVPDKTKFVDGYTYGFTPNQIKFDKSEIDHYKMPNPDDIYYGKGWCEAAWSANSLHNSRREEDQATADNMSRPDWLLSAKTAAAAATLDRLEKGVEEKFRGTDKRGRFLAVSGDVSATPLNWEVPEKGTPTRIIEEISAISGVPMAMLLSNDPTKATAVNSWLGWMRNTVAPYCRLREEKLNERHMTRYADGDEMFLAHDPASFEDREAETRRLIGEVSAGIRTSNEARQAIGLPHHEDGDVLHPPAGISGGAAAEAGNMAPRQNDRRTNEDAERAP